MNIWLYGEEVQEKLTLLKLILSKSQFNFIIINSNLKNEGHDNIAFINTQDIKEQIYSAKFFSCIIILSKNSQEYFKNLMQHLI